MRVILWWVVPDALLVDALGHARVHVVLTRKVKFGAVYWDRRFDYVMIIRSLLIIRDLSIGRRGCWSIPIIIWSTRMSHVSVHIQRSVAVSPLDPWLAVLLHQVRVDVNLFDSFDYRLLSCSHHLLRSALVHEWLASLKPFHKVWFLVHRVLLVMQPWNSIVLAAGVSLYHERLLAPQVSPRRVGIEVKVGQVVLLYGVVSVLESYLSWLAHGVEIHFLNLFHSLLLEFRTLHDLFADISYTLLLVGLPLLEFDL